MPTGSSQRLNLQGCSGLILLSAGAALFITLAMTMQLPIVTVVGYTCYSTILMLVWWMYKRMGGVAPVLIALIGMIPFGIAERALPAMSFWEHVLLMLGWVALTAGGILMLQHSRTDQANRKH